MISIKTEDLFCHILQAAALLFLGSPLNLKKQEFVLKFALELYTTFKNLN